MGYVSCMKINPRHLTKLCESWIMAEIANFKKLYAWQPWAKMTLNTQPKQQKTGSPPSKKIKQLYLFPWCVLQKMAKISPIWTQKEVPFPIVWGYQYRGTQCATWSGWTQVMGRMVYVPMSMVDFYGKLISKVNIRTSPMDASWDEKNRRRRSSKYIKYHFSEVSGSISLSFI